MELYDTNAVCAWLRALGLEDPARIAEREGVDGYVLLELIEAGDRGLERIGLTDTLSRAKVKGGVARLSRDQKRTYSARDGEGKRISNKRARPSLPTSPIGEPGGATAAVGTVQEIPLPYDDWPAPAGLPRVYVSPPPENLECAVCTAVVMQEPHMIKGGCAHSFCRECLVKCLQRKRECPKCKQPAMGQPRMESLIIRNTDMCGIAAAQKIRCPNGVRSLSNGSTGWCADAAGCQSELVVQDLEQHLQTCEYHIVACSGASHGCTWKAQRRGVAEHESSCVFVKLDAHFKKTMALEEKVASLTRNAKLAQEQQRQRAIMRERRDWQLSPLPGFHMRWRAPGHLPDNRPTTPDLVCAVPGPVGSDFEGGFYPVQVFFPPCYPERAPRVRLPAGFYCMNVYPSGTVSTSVLNEDEDWEPSLSVKELLVAVQETLSSPNSNSPAQVDAYRDFSTDMSKYKSKMVAQARQYSLSCFLSAYPGDATSALPDPTLRHSESYSLRGVKGQGGEVISNTSGVVADTNASGWSSWSGVRVLNTVPG